MSARGPPHADTRGSDLLADAEEEAVYAVLAACQRTLRLKGLAGLSERAYRTIDHLPNNSVVALLTELTVTWTDADAKLKEMVDRADSLGAPRPRPGGPSPRRFTDGGRLPVKGGDVIQLRGLVSRPDLNFCVGALLEDGPRARPGRLPVKLLNNSQFVSVPEDTVYHIWDAEGAHPFEETLHKWRGTQAVLARFGARTMSDHALRYLLLVPRPLLESWLNDLTLARGELQGDTIDLRFRAHRCSLAAPPDTANTTSGPECIYCPACGHRLPRCRLRSGATLTQLGYADGLGNQQYSIVWTCRCCAVIHELVLVSRSNKLVAPVTAVVNLPPRFCSVAHLPVAENAINCTWFKVLEMTDHLSGLLLQAGKAPLGAQVLDNIRRLPLALALSTIAGATRDYLEVEDTSLEVEDIVMKYLAAARAGDVRQPGENLISRTVYCPVSGTPFHVNYASPVAGRLVGSTLYESLGHGGLNASVLYECSESGDRLTVSAHHVVG